MSRRAAPVVMFFLLLAGQAYADGAVGFYGGLSSAGVSGDTPPNTSYGGRSGLVFAVFGEIRIAKDVMLGLQPSYIQKGSTLIRTPPDGGDPIEQDLSLDYFSVPVMFKINTGRTTYFSGGLDLGVLLDASLTTDSRVVDVNSLVKDFDLSMDFAFGGMIDLGSPFLTLEIRYSQSLLNIADTEKTEGDTEVPARFRSKGFQFLAGLLFPLGGK